MLNAMIALERSKTLLATQLDQAATTDPSSELTKEHLDALMLLNYKPSSTK